MGDLIDFTLSNARQFYSSKGQNLAAKGIIIKDVHKKIFQWKDFLKIFTAVRWVTCVSNAKNGAYQLHFIRKCSVTLELKSVESESTEANDPSQTVFLSFCFFLYNVAWPIIEAW